MRNHADLQGYRTLLRLAWPVVVARSAQAVIGFCDALMSAPLGAAPLAAVTTGAMNTFAITVLPMGLVFIAQSFAAQLLGKRRIDVAIRYAWYGLIIAAIVMALAVASIPMIGPALGLLGYEPQVHRLMAGYLRLRAFSVAAIVGTEALGNWYGGLGHTRPHMTAGLVAMVVNIFLNWMLIYGHLGVPALGVTGAALASVAASWIGFAVIATAFWQTIGVPAPTVRPCGLRAAELARMVRFGLPYGLNWFLEFAAFALFINVVVADLGTTVLAAMMVVININSVSFMPSFGIASAGAILSGQAIGRSQPDLVRQIVRRTLTVALCWQGAIGLLYLLLPARLMGLFAGNGVDSIDLLRIGTVLLAISAAWQLFDATGITLGEALRSAGDTTWVLWARVVLAWLIFVPAALISVSLLKGGYVAAMLCVVGYLAALAVALVWRFRSGAWRRIDLTGIEPQQIA